MIITNGNKMITNPNPTMNHQNSSSSSSASSLMAQQSSSNNNDVDQTITIERQREYIQLLEGELKSLKEHFQISMERIMSNPLFASSILILDRDVPVVPTNNNTAVNVVPPTTRPPVAVLPPVLQDKQPELPAAITTEPPVVHNKQPEKVPEQQQPSASPSLVSPSAPPSPPKSVSSNVVPPLTPQSSVAATITPTPDNNTPQQPKTTIQQQVPGTVVDSVATPKITPTRRTSKPSTPPSTKKRKLQEVVEEEEEEFSEDDEDEDDEDDDEDEEDESYTDEESPVRKTRQQSKKKFRNNRGSDEEQSITNIYDMNFWNSEIAKWKSLDIKSLPKIKTPKEGTIYNLDDVEMKLQQETTPTKKARKPKEAPNLPPPFTATTPFVLANNASSSSSNEYTTTSNAIDISSDKEPYLFDFDNPVILTQPMKEAIGKTFATKTELFTKLWEYLYNKNLFNEQHNVLMDPLIRRVLGVPQSETTHITINEFNQYVLKQLRELAASYKPVDITQKFKIL